jgi:outer membrane protein TolC
VSFPLSATTNAATSGKWHDESLAATLTWTLYDAGVRYADKHSRDASAEIADLTLVALVRNVDSQVRGAVVTMLASQTALRASERAMEASRHSVDETAVLYKQGLAKAIELVDANDSRFIAEVNYAQAEYSLALAYIALRQALGLDPLGTEVK